MRAKVLSPGNPRVIALVFDTGEEPVAALSAFAAEHGFHAASFSAIGAFEQATHAHAVLGRCDGSTCGGHLLSAKVRPTLEVILTQAPSYLERVHDAESGLALIRLDR